MAQTLAEYALKQGFKCFTLDGQMHRYDRDGVLNAWFVGREYSIDGKLIQVANFGDWKTDEKYTWRNLDATSLSALEKEAIEEKLGELQREEEAERLAEQERVALESQARWLEHCTNRGSSPYFGRKGLPSDGGLYGCKLFVEGKTVFTVVPASDLSGRIWGLQSIAPSGEKRFTYGQKIKGLFHKIGGDLEGRVYLAEGIATAISVHLATGRPVLSCFNASNLANVARGLPPGLGLVVAADNDAETKRRDGTPWNPGLEAAQWVVEAYPGARVVAPRQGDKSCDFNDLHVARGLDEVKKQIEGERAPGLVFEASTTQGVVLELPNAAVEKPKKKKGLSEKQLATILLNELGDDLVKQEKDLFLYDGTRWVEVNEAGISRLKNRLNSLMGDKLASHEVNSAYATFFRYVTPAPAHINFFVPNPSCANFSDGTLHVRRDVASGHYRMEFLPHSRTDYLTWVVPVPYHGDEKEENPLFQALLDEAFEGDPDREGKIACIEECAGAMLMPAFPQLFFFEGVSGSRKSTIAKCLIKTLHMDNIAWVDPKNMEGFQLQGLIGKLINVQTDIDEHVPLPRGFMKGFEDRLPFQVNRKGKAVVSTMLPAVHLYCANSLPPNFEGESKAFQRRVSIVSFKNDLTNDRREKQITYYEDLVYAAGQRGMLNFHLRGLKRLVANGGKFTPPDSGREKLASWQLASDPVGRFLHAVKEGEIVDGNTRLIVGEGRIKTSVLWEIYKTWENDAYSKCPGNVNKFSFYDRIDRSGFKKCKSDGVYYFMGLLSERVDSGKH